MKNYYFIFIFLGSTSFLSAQGITFTSQTFGGNSSICCVADMNNDFLDDIVTVQSSQMTVYKQKTIGGFDTSIIPFATAVNTPDWSIASGDYDRNGFNDLVLGNGSRVTVLKADDTGSNYSIIAYPQNIFTQRTNFIDINNDGNLDLWVSNLPLIQ